MKTLLYIACSIDGYIAKPNWDSDWVSELDVEIFDSKIKECWCIIIWHNTFKQYEWELYPVPGVRNIVVSRSAQTDTEEVIYVQSVADALAIASENSYSQVLLVWGGSINTSFLKENQIHEIILSVHPLILWEGIQIFKWNTIEKNLELIETSTIWNELVHIKYKVK